MDFEFIIIMVLFSIFAIFCLVWFVKGLFNLGKAFWSIFDHSVVPKNTMLNPDAKIKDVYSEKVQYTKNGMKYKTTVCFADGFKFITHETEREEPAFGFTYSISISKELYKSIIASAIEAHDRAVSKQQKKFRT